VTVTQIYPTDDQVRARVKDAVMEAIRDEMSATGLGRFREFHLRGALEGVIEALAFFIVAWTKQDKLEGANETASDCAWLTRELVHDLVNEMVRTGIRNEAGGAS
jgi:hypothetical protein